MSTRIFSKKTKLPVSAAEAFEWHNQTGAFNRLLPPWEKIKILNYSANIKDGSRAELLCQIFGPLKFRWLLEHQEFIAGERFCDVQLSGPFARYKHSHLFLQNDNGAALEDIIEYSLPLAPISNFLAPILIDSRFKKTFEYRHRITSQDLAIHSRYKSKPRLSFLISGATGTIGKALCSFLTTGGHKVTRIVRTASQNQRGDVLIAQNGDITFDEGSKFDCVVNLAGAGIADKRWSIARKKILIESRIEFTKNLISALKKLPQAPKSMISASGLGFYGDSGDQYPDENSSKGVGFLADLSDNWEQAASEISATGCRLVTLRLAAVLTAGGGALQKMLLPFSLGLGGKLGNGKQKFAWVAIDDVLQAILFAAYEDKLSGAINVVAPSQTSNAEFTAAFGKALGRPTFLSIPSFVLRLIFGELAEETLLKPSAAKPRKLLEAGFAFLFKDPEQAIRAEIGKA